jgi:hypothetical protein
MQLLDVSSGKSRDWFVDMLSLLAWQSLSPNEATLRRRDWRRDARVQPKASLSPDQIQEATFFHEILSGSIEVIVIQLL